jgi:hypothetical protein
MANLSVVTRRLPWVARRGKFPPLFGIAFERRFERMLGLLQRLVMIAAERQTPPRSRCSRGWSRSAAGPGMYIGGTDERALHHLAAEVLDNAWTRRWPATPAASRSRWSPATG